MWARVSGVGFGAQDGCVRFVGLRGRGGVRSGRRVSERPPDDPEKQPEHISVGEAFGYIAPPRFVASRSPVDLEGLRHLISLFFLTCVGVIVVGNLVWSVIIPALGGSMPEHANEALLENPARMVLVGIVLAPLIEELVFRSWLGARRASVWGLPVLAAMLTVLSLSASKAGGGMAFPAGLVVGFLATAVVVRARSMAESDVAAVRDRVFPVIFWLTAVLFALLHTTNFGDGLSGPLLLIGVLPQLVVGLVLGYVRMRFGLASAILFHGAYNALILTLGLLTTSVAESAPELAAPALLF